ncbi:MAG: acyl-CoA dehydrogenase family protein, partial [Pseudomonadota bacterium]
LFRRNARNYIDRELTPQAEEWERACTVPREAFRELGKRGFFGLSYPESVGGAGGDYWYNIAFSEELQRTGSAGLSLAFGVHAEMATPIINAIGSKAQKEEFLIPAINGERIAALGISEPGAGSDFANLQTTARRDGDDYVIDGAKTFITNGTCADFITLAVRTGQPGMGGISIILFPTETKGFRVGRKLEKVGNRSSDTAELFFDGCRVPARYMLGEENRGFYYLLANLQNERLVLAISSLAAARLAIDESLAYGRDRRVFGHALTKYQVWRHEFVQLLTELEAGRSLAYRAADLYVRKKNCVSEITMAKIFCCELAQRVIDRCLQFHGGYGYMDEYRVSRRWRDIRLMTIGGGTTEVMREMLARQLGID